MKLFVVIPAYNEESTIAKVIKDVKKRGYRNIVVVDDGSSDKTYRLAKSQNVTVLRHILNRGLGGALGTGIRYALEKGADIIVTFDADGQHDPGDIARLVAPVKNKKADVVIGSRMLKPEGMPLLRKIGNYGLNFITRSLFGVWTTDSQSGLRCFSRKAAEIIEIKTNRMEVSSEIIKEVGHKKLKLKEVPIKAIYTDYSMKKGQTHFNAFRILTKLVLRKIMR